MMGLPLLFFIDMRKVLSMVVLTLLLAGCRTKYVAVPEYRYRDSVQVRHERDSVYLHDSVYVSERMAGDTVYLTRYRERTLYRDRLHTDTLRTARTDSICVPYPVERRVEVTPPWSWYVLLYAVAVTVLAGFLIRRRL